MKAEIKGGAAFGYLDIELDAGEELISESDAMSSMSTDIDVAAKLNGGFWIGLARKFLGGETLFINHYKNVSLTVSKLTVVQPTPGQLYCKTLKGEGICLQPGAFLACTKGINFHLRWAGLVSWFSGEGLFKYYVDGEGMLWYGAYGALVEKEIDGEYIVDTSHLVAYDPQLKLKLQLAGGLFSSFFGGEGFVTRIEGKGKIVIQTRSLSGFTGWINPRLGG